MTQYFLATLICIAIFAGLPVSAEEHEYCRADKYGCKASRHRDENQRLPEVRAT